MGQLPCDRRPGSKRRTQTLLVDWELAGRGEAALDIGTVLAEYLSAWVGSIPIVEVATPGRLLSHAKYPLRRMQPATDAFWSAYCETTSTPPTLRRVLELTAVHLVQDGGRASTGSRGAISTRRDAAAARREHLARTREGGPRAAGSARMNDYRDQLAAAVRAVTIRSPTEYAWLGRPCRPLPEIGT